MVEVPPAIDMSRLRPTANSIAEIDIDDPTGHIDFEIPSMFDPNGQDDEIYGRFWVDWVEGTTTSTDILNIERVAQNPTCLPEPESCPGCCWEASFTVPPDRFTRGPGCYQVLAVFSDSIWTPCAGSMCTERETVLARVIWWVWAYEGLPTTPPAMTECQD